MGSRPVLIDIEAEQTVIRYTAGDDISVTATVLETVSGTLGSIVWGAATGVAQVREFETDATIAQTFSVDATVNGQLTIFMNATNSWALGTKKYKFSVQITRGGRKYTYWAGVLEPRLEATHP